MLKFIKKNWLWLILALGTVLLVIFLWLSAIQKKSAELKALSTFTFTAQDLVQSLSLSGVVDANRKINLYYPAGGKLVKLNASKSASVSEGEVLAVIDQSDLQKRLKKSLNNYLIERLQLDNFRNQLKDRVPTDNQNLTASTDQIILDNTVLDVEISSLAIQNTVLNSPIDGVLVNVPDLIPPMTISPNDYFTVVDPNSLIFRALVDETDLHLLKIGQFAAISFDALPDQSVTSYLSQISLMSTTGSGGTAFEVEFPLSGFDLSTFRLGMNGDASLILQEKKQVGTVPLEAVYWADNQNFVKVLTPDLKIIEKPIKVGLETDYYYEVISGLEFGEKVILN